MEEYFRDYQIALANEAYTYFDQNIRSLPKDGSGDWDFSTGAFVDNDVDAFRHAYAAAVSAYENSAVLTRLAGEWHEFRHPGTANAMNMDLWNNNYGLEIYNTLLPDLILNPSTYKAIIADAIADGLTNGDLIVDPNDPENPLIGPDDLSLLQPSALVSDLRV